MVCPRCGHTNDRDANFCSSCGTPLTHGEEATASIPAFDEGEARPDDAAVPPPDLPEGAGLIVVARGPNAGSTYLLDASATAAGRHPESDIFLDDITVSRRHVVFERAADRFRLRDVGSLNGTYVNRKRVEEAELADGDEIQIGRFVLAFHVGGLTR